MAKGKMSKVDLENLIRAKLYCSYSYFMNKEYIAMYIAYKEAMAMWEVLHTFFSAKHLAHYYYTCESVQYQHHNYIEWKQEIEKISMEFSV